MKLIAAALVLAAGPALAECPPPAQMQDAAPVDNIFSEVSD